MFTGKWKYVGKNLIQIIKAILQLGLVLKKGKSEGENSSYFLVTLNDEVVSFGTENGSFACPAELFHAVTSRVPSSLSPPCSVMSLLWCSEPCCPGWNLETVSKLVFLTWQHMMRLVGNLPYPFFVKHQSWCLTLNPGIRTGRVKCRVEPTISAECFCGFSAATACDWYSVLVVIEWQRFCFFPLCNLSD